MSAREGGIDFTISDRVLVDPPFLSGPQWPSEGTVMIGWGEGTLYRYVKLPPPRWWMRALGRMFAWWIVARAAL